MPLVSLVEIGAGILEAIETAAVTAEAAAGRGPIRRRPRRAVVVAGSVATIAGGVMLAYWFETLYDRAPGWATAAVGTWLLLAFATLVAATVRRRAGL